MKEVTGQDKHDQKSMERNSFGYIDALIHLCCIAAEICRRVSEVMKTQAETWLETTSRNAEIAIICNIVFPDTAGSWRRAIGNLIIQTVRQ